MTQQLYKAINFFLCFSYPTRPGHQVLKTFNLTLPPSKTVAIVGESGGGNSYEMTSMAAMWLMWCFVFSKSSLFPFRKIHRGLTARAFLRPHQWCGHARRPGHPHTRSVLAEGASHRIYQSGIGWLINLKQSTVLITSCLILTAPSVVCLHRSRSYLDHQLWKISALGNRRPQMPKSLMRRSRPTLTASLQASQMATTH